MQLLLDEQDRTGDNPGIVPEQQATQSTKEVDKTSRYFSHEMSPLYELNCVSWGCLSIKLVY